MALPGCKDGLGDLCLSYKTITILGNQVDLLYKKSLRWKGLMERIGNKGEEVGKGD